MGVEAPGEGIGDETDRQTEAERERERLLYLIREIKTWLNINHITVHNKTYCVF